LMEDAAVKSQKLIFETVPRGEGRKVNVRQKKSWNAGGRSLNRKKCQLNTIIKAQNGGIRFGKAGRTRERRGVGRREHDSPYSKERRKKERTLRECGAARYPFEHSMR